MSLRYYRRPWNECRGDQFDSWGRSVWYFEIDDAGYPVRRIEEYENGPVLQYDSDHHEDDHGRLGEGPIDRDDFAPFEIKPEEFDAAWSRHTRA